MTNSVYCELMFYINRSFPIILIIIFVILIYIDINYIETHHLCIFLL